jgi:hypothetical protein
MKIQIFLRIICLVLVLPNVYYNPFSGSGLIQFQCKGTGLDSYREHVGVPLSGVVARGLYLVHSKRHSALD